MRSNMFGYDFKYINLWLNTRHGLVLVVIMLIFVYQNEGFTKVTFYMFDIFVTFLQYKRNADIFLS